MKKSKLLVFILALIMVLLSVGFFGCVMPQEETAVYVVSIEKTSSEGLKDIYTITYSDGTTSTLEVTNGEDGEKGAKGTPGKDGKDGEDGKDGVDGENGLDGEDLTIEDVYAKYLEENPNATYEEFLKAVLSVNTDGNSSSINKALLTSAKIFTEFTKTTDNVTNTSVSAGSAVIYKITNEYTYFITNYHVVYEKGAHEPNKIAKKITCYLYGSEGGPSLMETKDEYGYNQYDYGAYGISCEYVGGAASADLAVVRASTDKVKSINPDATAVVFADDYHVGETAIAIGNPESEGVSVSEGIVSVDNEYINLSIDSTRKYRSMRIDTVIYHGNSGGGLYNTDGKLIGITNAGDVTNQSMNYAIPIDIVKPVVENIMYYSSFGETKVKKITLGVTVVSQNSKYVFDEQIGYGKIVEDVVVKEVTGPITIALGLMVGDRIDKISVGGTTYEIDRYFEIGDILYTIRSGDSISVTYERGGVIYSSTPYTVKDTDLLVVE